MGLYKAIVNPSVWLSIRKARKWYRDISPELSVALNAEISLFVEAVSNGPFHFSIRFLNVRRVNLGRFPYAFHYTINEESKTVTFLNFFHTKMDMPYSNFGNPDNLLNEP